MAVRLGKRRNRLGRPFGASGVESTATQALRRWRVVAHRFARDDQKSHLRPPQGHRAPGAGSMRQTHNTRRLRSGGEDRRGQIPEMVSIHVRPLSFNDRVMPGHSEGDLIEGAGDRSRVVLPVERPTRLMSLAKIPDSTAESALVALTAKLDGIVQPLLPSLTYGGCREMARLCELACNTNI
jgi:IS30 family transposase